MDPRFRQFKQGGLGEVDGCDLRERKFFFFILPERKLRWRGRRLQSRVSDVFVGASEVFSSYFFSPPLLFSLFRRRSK